MSFLSVSFERYLEWLCVPAVTPCGHQRGAQTCGALHGDRASKSQDIHCAQAAEPQDWDDRALSASGPHGTSVPLQCRDPPRSAEPRGRPGTARPGTPVPPRGASQDGRRACRPHTALPVTGKNRRQGEALSQTSRPLASRCRTS